MRGKCSAVAGLALVISSGVYAQFTTNLYQTGFENPPFVTGGIAGQDSWNVFGTAAAVTIQTAVVKTGTQAVLVDASQVIGQTGPWRDAPFDTAPSYNNEVTIDADVFLASSANMTSWQFAAQKPNLGGFIAGFNVLVDGTLELITPGFPVTSPVVARDTWMHYTVALNFATQTFDVYINYRPVATALPFVSSPTKVFGGFLFDTFDDNGGANDKAYLDNLSIQSMEQPDLFLMSFFS